MCQCRLLVVGCEQVLDVAAQSRGVTYQQYYVDRQPAAAAGSLHHHLRPTRHAAVRRQVQLRRNGTEAAAELRHDLPVAADRLPGDQRHSRLPHTGR